MSAEKFLELNAPRVEQIKKILIMMERSAKSQKAPAEHAELLGQVASALSGAAPVKSVALSTAVPASSARATLASTKVDRRSQWADACDMARHAPLSCVNDAMQIFLTRIGDELHEKSS